ncbi:hypothetical protein GTU79_01470 [Sodalis ligni]|uniref:hypothetical protein n=1 Tax=Sodalis ligni TaxID=2697027 RepID=UPI001BDDE579|nr:hypothetical protein [Sodalis ligni]QWA11521.1 hypothetical protein GTU79_01470 [Sodalis ligni]
MPVRVTQHKGQGVLYEVYNVKNPDNNGWPVEWDGERWIFERQNSVHVSRSLKEQVSPDMFAKDVNARTLSAPDHMGLRVDLDGNKYIKVNDNFIKIEHQKDLPFIRNGNGDKIYLNFKKNKFYPVKFERKNGSLVSNQAEMKKIYN